ncbi:MAG: T9SS type A sorting domain-containing protein [Bacteroidetes bacterium]|nr:T9SS type A sorting domain-containing protein [Bacteroidota bacterium]
MKKYLLLMFTFSILTIKAQYTITSVSSPIVGDIDASIPVDTSGLFVPSNGTGQSWNYSAVIENTTAINSNSYVPLSAIPNASLYSGATIGATIDNVNFDVYNNGGGTIYMGTSVMTASDCVVFSDAITYLTYPFTYGNSYTDNFYLNNSSYVSSGTVVVSGDGTGVLSIPNFVFNNVLKVSQSYTQTLAAGTATYLLSGRNHNFYSAMSKFPLFTISTYTQVGGGSPTVITINAAVNKNFTPLGISKKTSENDFLIYPNPSKGGDLFIMLSKADKDIKIILTNMIGCTVKEYDQPGAVAGNEFKISSENISPGIYFLTVKSGSFEKVKKVVVE